MSTLVFEKEATHFQGVREQLKLRELFIVSRLMSLSFKVTKFAYKGNTYIW